MATDQKVSQLTTETQPEANDVLLIVVYPFNTASSRKITVEDFFGNIPVDVAVSANISGYNLSISDTITANTVITSGITTTHDLVIGSNNFILTDSFTPANSHIVEATKGKIFYDDNYLYVTTANSVIKRVQLGSF